MKSIRIIGPNDARFVTDAPKPILHSPDRLLIKVVAVALNPGDYKHIVFGAPATVGLDFSGVVEEVGSAITSQCGPGDRVFGMVYGSNQLKPDNGAFAEDVVADIPMRIPEGKSFEEAAGGGTAFITVGQGLYQEINLPWPGCKEAVFELKERKEGEKKKILIWDGSSGMGAVGIQFAKLSGFEVITTCSPGNFDYVKSLGADAVFDSRSSTTGSDIRAYTNNRLYYAWDTLGEYGAPEGCAEALASNAPYPEQQLHYGTIMAFPGSKPIRDDVVHHFNIACTASGEELDVMGVLKQPGIPSHRAFAIKWAELAEKLYTEGVVKMHRLDFRQEGFEGILEGLADLKEGRIGGKKVVYRVGEP